MKHRCVLHFVQQCTMQQEESRTSNQNNLFMEKIKVLQITQSVGGVETYLRQMLQNIDRNRFEVIIVSCEPSLKQYCEEANVKYYEVKNVEGLTIIPRFYFGAWHTQDH